MIRPVLPIADIEARLATRKPRRHPTTAATREAAVAVVLREWQQETEVLFIKRAEKQGDPWSGHMAFPGGHREPDDADLAAAAMRETHEEIGLPIVRSQLIGELPEQRPAAYGRRPDMLVAPYVFAIGGDPAFALSHEVDAAVWTRLAPMRAGDNHTQEDRLIGGTPTPFNGYRVNGGHFVWGLTYRVVQTFFEVLDPEFVPSA